MKSLIWASGFLIVFVLAWWLIDRTRGGADESRLLEIPYQVQEALEFREFGEATRFLAPDFEYKGMNRNLVRVALQTFVEQGEWVPYVAKVVLEDDGGQDVRRFSVAGILIPGGLLAPEESSPRSWRPFRVDATARPRSGDWEIIDASLH